MVKTCIEMTSGKNFAAKFIKYDESTKSSVMNEYEIAKRLTHERFVALHEAYIVRKYLILVMEK